MNGHSPSEIVLWFVVIIYWSAVLVLMRSRRVRAPLAVLILPVFFLMLGTIINRFWAPIGTYAVVFIHLVLLQPLWRIANSKTP